MSDERRDEMKRVEFGIEVEAFIRGPIGSFLVQRLHDERDQAVEDLKTVDPTDAGKIAVLQETVRRSHNVENWLGGIIQEGYLAERQLKGEES